MERLNKYLAHAGVGSRRYCDELILHGRVQVDGQVVRELGSRVEPGRQAVAVDGRPLQEEPPVYWLVNKPRGYLCTNHDPAGRPLAIDLVPHVPQRVYTVGRLDEDSEGLLLLTNDGELAHRLMHPRFGVEKTYLVQVAGLPTPDDLQQLLKGVWLSDGQVRARRVKRLKSQGESAWLEIVLNEGKNREIRRMLARLGHKVMRLKRIAIGPVRLDRLPGGKARRLRPDDLARLRLAGRGARRPDAAPPAEDKGHAAPEERRVPAARAPRPEGRPKKPVERGDARGVERRRSPTPLAPGGPGRSGEREPPRGRRGEGRTGPSERAPRRGPAGPGPRGKRRP